MTFVIAIDGPAASGKGTLSRKLGSTLNCAVMDTGMLYRATGYLVLENNGDPSNKDDAIRAVQELASQIDTGLLTNHALRSARASDAASRVSAIPEVRSALLDMQRDFAQTPPKGKDGSILDGRDIGTVVCPDAEVKIFITAEPEIRAERRARQTYGDEWAQHYEEELEQTIKRDKRDMERATAPLKPADDALVLDTSALGINGVFEEAMSYIKEKLSI